MGTNPSKLHAILFAGLFLASCGNGNNTNNASSDSTSTTTASPKADTATDKVKAGAENMAGAVQGAMSKNEDSNFVVNATITNNAELKVLQAGIDKGTDKEVKSHAKMMLADHKMLGEKVKAYAAKKGYTLPDGDNGKGDDAIAKLDKNNPGKDWDKAWADHMVSAHEDAIGQFERGQGGVKDDELKGMITSALTKLRAHLEMAKKLKDKLGK